MERFGITKLNGSNYAVWKTKIEFLLVREDLWKYVVPPAPAAASTGSGSSSGSTTTVATQTAAELQAWNSGDQKARATIGLLIEDNQLNLIKTAKTAEQTWKALRDHYEKATLTSKVSLLKKLCDKRYADGEDIERHVFEMEELFERLSVAGQALDQSLQVAMVLRSLPESFNTLTTALETRSDAELTLELIKTKLADEVAKRGSSGSSESVLKADTEKQRKPPLCNYCQKPGHKRKQCRARIQKEEAESKPGERQEKQCKTKAKTARQDGAGASRAEFSFLALKQSCNRDVWVIDSGATSHMCVDRRYFKSLDDHANQAVYLADGKEVTTQGVGSCELIWESPEGAQNKVDLSEVMYVPEFETNLISVRKLCAKGLTVVFDINGCRILKDNVVIGDTTMSGGLYKLNTAHEALRVSETKHNPDCLHSWHRILGHREPDAIRELETKDLATGIKIKDCGCTVTCECCLEGKLTRLPFPKRSKKKSKMPLDIIHTDVCGPMKTPTQKGCRYFLTMIDDYSRYTVVYFMKQKSEVVEHIKEYVQFVKTSFGRTPKVIRSDQGGEYKNEVLTRFCRQEGIRQQFTTAYTPQQNGVSERKNRSLVEMARCMILDAKLSYKFWAEAVNTATYLQNRLPTKPLSKTPFELWTGEKPDMSHLKLFGSWAYVWVPGAKRSKLDAKAKKLMFVGYSLYHKAYRFLDPETFELTVSRDCRFLTHREVRETEPSQGSIVPYPFTEIPLKSSEADEVPVVTDDPESDDNDDDAASEEEFSGFETATSENDEDLDDTMLPDDDGPELDPQPASGGGGGGPSVPQPAAEGQEELGGESSIRRSTRATKGVQPQRFRDTVGLSAQECREPRSYQEAVSSDEREFWLAAICEELNSLQSNGTWEEVELPAGVKPIGCRWIFKRKRDADGKVIRYKARLVAQGFTQVYGKDYDEVFAPVAKHVTLRALLTIAAEKDMLVKHVDVKTAYLHGDLNERIFMKMPAGVEATKKNAVCLLKKSLYGLKQSGRMWNQRINNVLRVMGFKPAEADPCLYVRQRGDKLAYILLYVDDMLVACSSQAEYQEIVEQLGAEFELTLLGDVQSYIGVQVEKRDGYYYLNQKTYIQKLAEQFGMLEAKSSRIPMDPGYIQQKEEGDKLPSNEKFQSLIGGLLYIAVCSRPDIAISTSILGRCVSQPTTADWNEAKRVLRYLRCTCDVKLRLGGGQSGLEGFADADWAGNAKDRKSNSGFLFRLNGGMISWSARKQSCVALSSTEAEYISLSECCQELKWLLKLMKDFRRDVTLPIKINEDNQSCIKLLKHDGGTKRSKHVDTKYHFIRDLTEKKTISVTYCASEEMLADMLTKPLQRVKLEALKLKLGLVTC